MMKHCSLGHRPARSLAFLIPVMAALLLSSCATPPAAIQPEPFTLVILPDTQIYPHDRPEWRRSSRKEIFVAQTRWIADNAKKENIPFVLHMGDIVHVESEPYQWVNANRAMTILDGVVPYAFCVGNHDLVNSPEEGSGIVRDSTHYNQTFPYTRYEHEPWYGGRMANDGYLPQDNNDNAYFFFDAGGMEFMVVTLECGPTDAMVAWADIIITSHPDKRVIVMTHSYMLGDNTRDPGHDYLPPTQLNSGEQIWQKLIRKHANILFVLSGHHNNSPTHRGLLASTGDHGNTVYQLISGEDYDGWLRLMRFVPAENKIVIKTYSPWQPDDPQLQFMQYDFTLPGYHRDDPHEYELPYQQLN